MLKHTIVPIRLGHFVVYVSVNARDKVSHDVLVCPRVTEARRSKRCW